VWARRASHRCQASGLICPPTQADCRLPQSLKGLIAATDSHPPTLPSTDAVSSAPLRSSFASQNGATSRPPRSLSPAHNGKSRQGWNERASSLHELGLSRTFQSCVSIVATAFQETPWQLHLKLTMRRLGRVLSVTRVWRRALAQQPSARRSQTCLDLQHEETIAPLRGRHSSAVDHVCRTSDGSN
jgi:hypothetical protein